MKRIVGRMAVAGLAVVLAAGPVSAQARGYVGFGAGIGVPVGDFADLYKTGWLGQVVAGITAANGKLGGRIDGSYGQNSIKGTVGGGKLKLIGVNADIVFTPGQRPAKIHPYLLAGVGFYHPKDGDTKAAFNGGAGIQFHTGSKMDVYTEARFVSIRTEGGASNMIPITLGLRWGGI